MFTKYPRSAGTALVLSTVLAVSACGSPEPAASPAGTSSQSTAAASTTAAPKAYTDKASFIAALKAATKDVTTVHMTMEMSGQGQDISMEGDSRLSAGDPASAMTLKAAGMDLQLVMVDKKIYAKGLPGQDPAKWAVLDANSAMGKELSSSAEQLDPAKMYDEFDQALTSVKHTGTETLDGEEMNVYELTLDTKSLPDMPTQAAELPETITYTAWLDSKDRMRKVTFEILGIKAEVTMSKYGEPVTIKAPPANQTVKVAL